MRNGQGPSEHTALHGRPAPVVARLMLTIGLLATASASASAQGTAAAAVATLSVPEQLAAGNRAHNARQPREALAHYELVLQTDPRQYEALWKASESAIDLGELDSVAATRAGLFVKGAAYARRALEVNDAGADAHFSLARALGRTALTLGPRERVRYATEVRAQALRTLELDAKHAGALHIMGVWNAEVMRLNSLSRLLAKKLLGGQVFGTASWPAAVSYLEQSVAVDPVRSVHRLDLARVYRDTGRKAEARAAYEAALRCPLVDPSDELYRAAAAAELRALK